MFMVASGGEACVARHRLRAVHTFHWSGLGGGFSVDAGVRIEATDRTGLERLKQRGADLVYRCGKGHAESLPSSK